MANATNSVLACAFASAGAALAHAQDAADYPNRPIRVIVPVGSGRRHRHRGTHHRRSGRKAPRRQSS